MTQKKKSEKKCDLEDRILETIQSEQQTERQMEATYAIYGMI